MKCTQQDCDTWPAGQLRAQLGALLARELSTILLQIAMFTYCHEARLAYMSQWQAITKVNQVAS